MYCNRALHQYGPELHSYVTETSQPSATQEHRWGMNERVNGNIYLGHNNFHTNACMFKSSGWTRCEHKSLHVHSARMNQVCTQKLACSYRHDEPGVHMNQVCTWRLACSHRHYKPGLDTKALRVHIARMNQVCTQKLVCSHREDEPWVHNACESPIKCLCHLHLDRTWDVNWVLKDNYWLNLQQVTPVITYTNHKIYEV